MDEYFEILKYEGITSSNAHLIHKWSKDERLELVHRLYQKLPIWDNQEVTGRFNFVANNNMSGSMGSCFHINCRLKNIDNLARFSTLYADIVFIENPFEKYKSISEFNGQFTDILIDDIRLIYYIRPLLDAGIIKLIRTSFHFCADCSRKVIESDNEYNSKLKAIELSLTNKFIEKVSIKYIANRNAEAPYLAITGPTDYMPHAKVISLLTPKALETLKGLFDIRHDHSLSSKEIFQARIPNRYIDPVFNDLIMRNIYSDLYGAQYITDRQVDFEILNQLTPVSPKQQNIKLLDALDYSVPYVRNVELGPLVDFRLEEGESFIVYRDAVKKVMSSISSGDAKFCQEAFSDLIEPELHNINLTIKNSKILLKGNISKSIIEGFGKISIGFFAGFLPPDIGMVLGSLGGILSGINVIKDTINYLDEPSQIRDNKFYFLWKIDQMGKPFSKRKLRGFVKEGLPKYSTSYSSLINPILQVKPSVQDCDPPTLRKVSPSQEEKTFPEQK